MAQPSHLFLFFLGAAFMGALGDTFHVASGVLGYPSDQPHLGLVPLWVPPHFGLGGVAIRLLYGPLLQQIARLFPHTSTSKVLGQTVTLRTALPRQSWKKPVLAMIGFCALYLLSSLLNFQGFNDFWISIILTCGLISLWLSVADGSLPVAILAILTGLGGVAYESALCRSSVFWYNQPDAFLVRHWIFQLWASGSIAGSLSVLKLDYPEVVMKQEG